MSLHSPIHPKELKSYIDTIGYKESSILKENREETKKLGDISIMQIGAAQGAFLSILCKLANFKSCLEVGVFTGYSSLCIGSAISCDSKLTVIENNQEYLTIARKYWNKANITKKINTINKDALDALDELSKIKDVYYDFAFIDADKSNYCEYYKKVMTMMSSGGVICIDNTLWKGRVYDKTIASQSTQAIRDVNQLIKNDQRVEHTLLTIYDGMTICYIK
tara:strand:- start:323 stop:985 length:663 start_codon:yes stop_codon:yes gene_type:complete